MTIHFQMGLEDVLAFNLRFYASSPTMRSSRNRVRLIPAVILVAFGAFQTVASGWDWFPLSFCFAVALLWFVLYPFLFDYNIKRYCKKILKEESTQKSFGQYTLTFSDSGIHDLSPLGESQFPWSSVSRTDRTETHLMIFLNGPMGYPIPLRDIGEENAAALEDLTQQHLNNSTPS